MSIQHAEGSLQTNAHAQRWNQTQDPSAQAEKFGHGM